MYYIYLTLRFFEDAKDQRSVTTQPPPIVMSHVIDKRELRSVRGYDIFCDGN